jgi:hydantoinase/carbamoylase family amidase
MAAVLSTRDQGTLIAERLAALAAVGADPRGGVTRLAYTEPEREAHALFARWAAEDGKECVVDAAGNSVAVYREGSPYFLVGSHLDTVANGGGYDGAAGVVAGLSVAAALADRELSCGVRVVAFAGEEGARFGRPNLGSALAAGVMAPRSLARLADGDGTSLVEAARAIGLDPAATEPWIGGDVACFFEIHIEQGRVLEGSSTRLGLVDAIAGSIRLRLDVSGRADHSGATPMDLRADALAAASEIVLAVERIGRSYHSTAATVGRLEARPNSVTTVPGSATLWVDLRDVDGDVQRAAGRSLLADARDIAERRRVSVSAEVIAETGPVMLTAWSRALAHVECERRGIPYRVLPSGAGHDAAIVARRAPSSLLFVPCVDGVSHAPAEKASAEDIAEAAGVVAGVIAMADETMQGEGGCSTR